MEYESIAMFLAACESARESQIRWCDAGRFSEENLEGVSPGGFLNPFGYFVIGTTIGGNAIVVSAADTRVCFADHEWYAEDSIYYRDIGGDGQWHDAKLTRENVRLSLFCLAASRDEFLARLETGKVDNIMDDIG